MPNLPGFHNPLRNVFSDKHPRIGVQTEAEMRAYCKAWGIEYEGNALSRPEVRTVPHPRCAYRHLRIKPSEVRQLAGQLRAKGT